MINPFCISNRCRPPLLVSHTSSSKIKTGIEGGEERRREGQRDWGRGREERGMEGWREGREKERGAEGWRGEEERRREGRRDEVSGREKDGGVERRGREKDGGREGRRECREGWRNGWVDAGKEGGKYAGIDGESDRWINGVQEWGNDARKGWKNYVRTFNHSTLPRLCRCRNGSRRHDEVSSHHLWVRCIPDQQPMSRPMSICVWYSPCHLQMLWGGVVLKVLNRMWAQARATPLYTPTQS